MTVIDADKLPVRTVTVKRRMLAGKKPYYMTQRRRVVLAEDLERERRRKPINRMERIQRMSLDELAKFLISLMDGDDRIGYCQNRKEYIEALDSGTEDVIGPEQCEQCLKEWLLKEA